MNITSYDKVIHSGIIYGILFPNNYIYIGQTKNTINQRKNQHKQRMKELNRNSVLYKEMRKYGFENCIFVLIENNIPDSLLDSSEIKYINHFEKVLNTTKGRTINGGEFRKIDNKETILKIYSMLKDDSIPLEFISKTFDISVTEVGYINKGIHHNIYSKNSYPIRKYNKKLTEKEVFEIIDFLKKYNKNITITEYREQIANKYNKSLETIRAIDNGVSYTSISKVFCDKFPISQNKL